ncbi:MAG: fucose permease, partial [Verrucomicrobiaceae bacterium]|nr:fucose permease [Verrucomicrobiaceae bacterium]
MARFHRFLSMSQPSKTSIGPDMKLFWACFIALLATSFVFGVRANTIGLLQDSFNLSEAEKGNINGAGMWPFALSIIFFSLVIDRIGYKTVAIFAMVCHVVSLILTLRATGYQSFYWSTFLVAVANGTVESFINPVIATVFSKEKAKWLNILHAGWPAGLALGALFCALFPNTTLFFDAAWKFRFALCFVPVVIYALLILPRTFPVNERVAAGVTYRDMLREVGAVGFFMIGALVFTAVMQLLGLPTPLTTTLAVGAAVAIVAGLYTGSLGNWLFIMVLIIIGPLATTELGTDGWMPELLKLSGPPVPHFETWVFVYTSVIMTILRFYAGPIVERFSPIGLLVIGTAIAIVGLLFLSVSAGYVILAAATVYALGKTFLWSTTLGMTSEQFPKGGALTLNGVSAMGVLFLGVLGSPMIGYVQDVDVAAQLKKEQPAIFQKIEGEAKQSLLGKAPSLDQAKIKALPPAETKALEVVQNVCKKHTFVYVATLPAFMFVCYLGLFFYFKRKG